MMPALAAAESRPVAWRAIHATAVLVGGAAILVRGRPGAGKSRLALALLHLAAAQGWFARLVGDDRVFVEPVHGRLLVHAHPAIAGKIERRGLGIVEVPYEASALVGLVVDLIGVGDSCDTAPRIPAAEPSMTAIEGAEIPYLALQANVSAPELAVQILFESPVCRPEP